MKLHKALTEGADCPEWVYVFVTPGHPLATALRRRLRVGPEGHEQAPA